MTDIKQLIATYESSYVPGEERSKEYEREQYYKKTLKNRNLLLDTLIHELPGGLKINKDQKIQVRNLINTFNRLFKYLYGQGKPDECIILAFILFKVKTENTRIKPEDYTICKKYGLTSPVYMNIVSKIANYYMLTSPINIRQTIAYDHEILEKNNGA